MAEVFSAEDRELMGLMLDHGILFPPEFKDRVAGWIMEALGEMPRKQFPGLALLGVRDSGRFGTAFNTTGPNTNYISNPNGSPPPPHKISGLANGRYLVWLMCAPQSDYHASLAVNGEALTAAAGDPIGIYGGGGAINFHIRPRIINLTSDNNNTLEVVYRDPSAGATSTDGARIVAVRLGPPV